MSHARLLAELTRAGLTHPAAYLAALALADDGAAEIGPFTLTRATPARARTNPTGDTAA